MTPFAKGKLTTDGHCTRLRVRGEPGRWVLTDGYPDLKSRQPLYLWDLTHDRGLEIARLHTPRDMDGETRVDLHPRFSPDGQHICVDSARSGARRVLTLDVSSITGEE